MENEGMMAVIRGVGNAGLAVTLLDAGRQYTLMPDVAPQKSSSSQSHVASQHEAADHATHRNSGDQVSDGRYASSYQVAHCKVCPTSPPFEVTEFPPQRAEPCRGQGNFEVGGPGSGEAFNPSRLTAFPTRLTTNRNGLTCMEEIPLFPVRASKEPVDSFASSLRKYPCMSPEQSSETIERLINYSQNKSFLKYSKSPTRLDTGTTKNVTDTRTRQRYEESPTRERARREIDTRSYTMKNGKDLRLRENKMVDVTQSVYYPYSHPVCPQIKDNITGSNHFEQYGVNSVCAETQAAVRMASKQMIAEPSRRTVAVSMSSSFFNYNVNVSERMQSPPELDTNEKSLEIRNEARSVQTSNSYIELPNYKNIGTRRTKSEKNFKSNRTDLEDDIIEWLKQEIAENNPDYSNDEITEVLRVELRQISNKWQLLSDSEKLKIVRDCLKNVTQNHSCDKNVRGKWNRKSNRTKPFMDFSIQCNLLQTNFNKSKVKSKVNDLSEKELKYFLSKELVDFLERFELDIPTYIVEEIQAEIIDIIMNFTNNHGNLISKYLLDDIMAVIHNHSEFTDEQAKFCAESIIKHSFNVINSTANICQSFIVLSNNNNTQNAGTSRAANNTNDFSISAIRDEDINANLEVYITKLTQEIDNWLNNLQTQIPNDNNFRQVVINDLAGDIIDRQKYVELNPTAKISDEDELENLKYQIFKWINKLVGEENMETIEHASELMERIRRIPAPMLVKPPKCCKRPDCPKTSTPKKTGKEFSQFALDEALDQSVIPGSSNLPNSSTQERTIRKIGRNLPQSFQKYDPTNQSSDNTLPSNTKNLISKQQSRNIPAEQVRSNKTLPCDTLKPTTTNASRSPYPITPQNQGRMSQNKTMIDSPSIVHQRTLPDGSVRQTTGNFSRKNRRSLDQYSDRTLPNSPSIVQNSFRNADRSKPQSYSPNDNQFNNTFPSNRTPHNKDTSPGKSRRASAPNDGPLIETRPQTPRRKSWNNSGSKSCCQESSRVSEPTIKKLNEEYDEFLQNWIKQIPIQTSSEEDKALAEKARTGIYNGIWKAVTKLKFDQTAMSNKFYYEDVLDDEIEQLFSELPKTPEFESKKHTLKVQLIEMTTNTNEMIKAAAPSSYKQQLVDNVKLKIPRQSVRVDTEEDVNKLFEEFEILGLVDDFILYTNYKENDPVRANVYKNKLQKHAEELVNELKKTHGKELGHINRETYTNDIMNALLKVPLPSNETISNEADEVLIGLEVEQWFKDLPLVENQDYNEQLLRRRLRDNLSKKIHDFEKQGSLSGSEIDYELKQEVSRFLEKIPLQEGESLNINFMVDELTNRMKNRQRVGGKRRSVEFAEPIQYDQFSKDIPYSSSMIERQGPSQQTGSFQEVSEADVMRDFQGYRRYPVPPPPSLDTEEEFHTMPEDAPITRTMRGSSPGREPQQYATVPEWEGEDVVASSNRQQASGYSGPPAFHPRDTSAKITAPQCCSTPNQSPQGQRSHESAPYTSQGQPQPNRDQGPRYRSPERYQENQECWSPQQDFYSPERSDQSFHRQDYGTPQQGMPDMVPSVPRKNRRPRAFQRRLEMDETEDEDDYEMRFRCRCVNKMRCPRPWYPYMEAHCYPRYPPPPCYF